MRVAVILVVFALLLALPFIPGLLFMRRRRDEQPLHVDPDYSRDPLFFGENLRQKYAQMQGGLAAVNGTLLQQERADMTAHSEWTKPLLVSGTTTTGAHVSLGEVYLQGGGMLGSQNKVASVIADHDLRAGEQLQVKRFVEVKGNLMLGPDSHLGISAAATGRLTLQPGTVFQRLYGQPIVVEGQALHMADPPPSVGDQYLWARDSLRIPKNQVLTDGVICHGALFIGEDSTVLGDVKVYGDLHLLRGAHISGNVVVRGSVVLHGNNKIQGHVHTEKNLFVASGSTLGGPQVQLSFYAAGRTVLAPSVLIHGYLVSDRGGRVLRGGETNLERELRLTSVTAEPPQAG